jgi:hypothetical protein
MSPINPETDYYVLPDGRLVFTAAYLLRRGHCCGNGCYHCPYAYEMVAQPRRSELLKERAKRDESIGDQPR